MSLSKFTLSEELKKKCGMQTLVPCVLFAEDLPKKRKEMAKTANMLGRDVLFLTYNQRSTAKHFEAYDVTVTLRGCEGDTHALGFLVMKRLGMNRYETRFEAVHPTLRSARVLGCLLDIAAEVATFDAGRCSAFGRRYLALPTKPVVSMDDALEVGNAFVEAIMGLKDNNKKVTIVTFIDKGGPTFIEADVLEKSRAYVYIGEGLQENELEYHRVLTPDRRMLQEHAMHVLHRDKSMWPMQPEIVAVGMVSQACAEEAQKKEDEEFDAGAVMELMMACCDCGDDEEEKMMTDIPLA
jgi:hypothetical protein